MNTPLSFYFNNSSLPILACSKRYEYQVVKGVVVPDTKTDALVIGLTFHHFAKLLGTPSKEDQPPIGLINLILSEEHYPPEAKQLKKTVVLSLAEGADNVVKSQPLLFKDSRQELFFEIPETLYIGEQTINCINCGTIDLLSYIPHEDAVYITDYKTTEKEINGELVTQYTLSSQRFFYETALLNLADSDKLPPHYVAAIKGNRVKFAYWFYNWKTKQSVLLTHSWTNKRTLQQFNLLLREKKQYAAYLHLHPELSAKEGIMFGSCFRCPFTSICERFDDAAEAQLISNWAAGFKSYYPKH